MGELYGEVNKMTLEWQDGLMALTVRQCVQVSRVVVYKNNVKAFIRTCGTEAKTK